MQSHERKIYQHKISSNSVKQFSSYYKITNEDMGIISYQVRLYNDNWPTK
jgi:hypothetical protein